MNILRLFISSIFLMAILSVYPQNIREMDKGLFNLSFGMRNMTIDSRHGGRIVSFRYGDKEMLTGQSVHEKYYGATMWVSPQSDYWPPYHTLDEGIYKSRVRSNMLILESQIDSISRLRFVKKFSWSSSDSAIVITYQIVNASSEIKKVAIWDVERVKGGITIFPFKDTLKNCISTLDHVKKIDGFAYYRYIPDLKDKGQKLFATTRFGWMVHIADNLVFYKQFPTVQESCLPPNQGEVEIFAAPYNKYVELESHGAYTALEPGEKVSYRMKWYLNEIKN